MNIELKETLLTMGKSSRANGFWMAVHVLEMDNFQPAAQHLIEWAKGTEVEKQNPFLDPEYEQKIVEKVAS